MEQSKEKRSMYEIFDGFKSFISTFLGVIVALFGIAVVFVVASLEGTKEIKASNRENAILMSKWREENDTMFPEHKVDVITFGDKDYYFIITEYDENLNVKEWYFAYEGGLDYIFTDYKFYILTVLTIIVSVFVSQINYTTSVNSTMNTTKFLKTLKVYQDSKEKIAEHSQYLPMFCAYKNKQTYNDVKRNIIESADITYEFYNSKDFDINKLEKWQRKRLKAIKKIKIDRMSTSDLLQEKSRRLRKVSLLPISPERHKRNYMLSTFGTKTISSALSGLTVVLGVVLGNWVLGITYGFTVFVSFITSNITGGDYANNGLRQRFIAKSDYLNEFYNMKEVFIKQVKEEKQVIEEKNQEENYTPIVKPTIEKTFPLVILNT